MSHKKQLGYWLSSAILLGLSFPAFDVVPTGVLAWIAFVPILWATKYLPSFKTLLLFAFVYAAIYPALELWWVGYFGIWKIVFLILIHVPTLMLMWIGYYIIHKKYSWKVALLFFPILLTLSDWILHQMPHSMQLFVLPYSQSQNIWLIQFIDIFGMWGITFWLGVMNVLIIFAIKGKRLGHYLLPALWLAIPLIYSGWCMQLAPKSKTGDKGIITQVGIIQTNQDSYADTTSLQDVFEEFLSLGDTAVRNTAPDLLVFPEATVPLPILQNPEILNLTKQVISSWQTSIAIGFTHFPDTLQPYLYENNALVFTPQLAMHWDRLGIKPEDVKVYQKEHGLPFVELTPYFENTPTFRSTAMVRGHEPYTFNYNSFAGNKYKVGLSICWEQWFPNKIAALVDNGAQFLCFMNNDAWFGKTPGPILLKNFSRLRAIENRRSIVRSSNGGISCFIDPFGRIYGALPWFTSTTATQEVLCVDKKTFYTRHPRWFPKFCGVILLATLIGLRVKKNAHPTIQS